MATQYPNSGKLSDNRYKDNPKKPDMVGEIVMQRSALKELLGEHDGDDIVIKLSSWKMEGNYGPWMRLSWNNYKPKDKAEGAPKQAPQQNAIPDDDRDIPF
jgi:hypothetical protein